MDIAGSAERASAARLEQTHDGLVVIGWGVIAACYRRAVQSWVDSTDSPKQID